jgi:hypothetical protein
VFSGLVTIHSIKYFVNTTSSFNSKYVFGSRASSLELWLTLAVRLSAAAGVPVFRELQAFVGMG